MINIVWIVLIWGWVAIGNLTAVRRLSQYTVWLGYKDWVGWALLFPTAFLWPVWYIVMGKKSSKVNWIVKFLTSGTLEMEARNALHDELEAMYRGED